MTKKTKTPNVALAKFASVITTTFDKAEAELGPDTLSLTPDEKRPDGAPTQRRRARHPITGRNDEGA